MPVGGAPLPKLSDPETGPLHPQTLACTSTVVSAVTGLNGNNAAMTLAPMQTNTQTLPLDVVMSTSLSFPVPRPALKLKQILLTCSHKGLPAGSLHAFFFFRPKEAREPGGVRPNRPWARIGLEALGYETFRPSCARVGDFGALRRSSIGLLGFDAPGYGIFRLLGARLRDCWTFRR